MENVFCNFYRFLIVSVLLFKCSVAIVNEMVINLNDILNEKLMPVSMFIIGGRSVDYGQQDNMTTLENVNDMSQGNFQYAFGTMDFHR